MSASNILILLGGLGAFLFGMKYMGDGLALAAGPKLNKLLEKLTSTPFKGFLLGAAVTVVIQSSSATTVMVMGFLNAGIMELTQAAGVIIGANIGTTITSVLIALDISPIAPACIFIGSVMISFCKKKQHKHIGQIILGFGLLFQGLSTMSGAMSVLKDEVWFTDFIQNASNPAVGVLVGMLLCSVIQSSSASIGILQALAMQNLMPIHFALYIICGIEIGSVMPLFLASLSSKNNAKRASFIYFIYNFVGAVIFVTVNLLTPYTDWIATLSAEPVKQVMFCHIFFKGVTAVVLLPFTKVIVNLTYKIVPKKKHESEKRLLYIDKNMATASSVAIKQAYREVERMYDYVKLNFLAASEGVMNGKINFEELNYREDIINFLNHSITNFLVEFSMQDLPEELHNDITNLMHVIIDIERIGDHAVNISEKVQHCLDNGIIYSDEAQEEIKRIINVTTELLDKAMVGFSHGLTQKQANKLHDMEDVVDKLTIQSEDSHIERLREQKCRIEPGITFAELLHDYERVGDHADNIVWAAKMLN
jgi:phosphate:Na+ symporter